MSYYLADTHGEILWPTKEGQIDVRSKLPVGTYTIGQHPERGWFFKKVTDFVIKGKIYGKATKHADRILNTFHDRENTTGVLLEGEKGSGKTLLAKMMSQKAALDGISTFIINSPWCGDNFNTLIQSIDEPCIIIFDEFEKVFDNEEQEAVLTLLDGVYPSKKLFILTVNNKWQVNTNMKNRPGRLFYMISYEGLDAAFIREYCNDNLHEKKYIEQVVQLAAIFDSFNFDSLVSLVQEMNRYKESPKEAIEILNIRPFEIGSSNFIVSVKYKGVERPKGSFYPKTLRGNPMGQDELQITMYRTTEDREKNRYPELDDDEREFSLQPNDLKKLDTEDGTYIYVLNQNTSEEIVITYTKEPFQSSYNYMGAIGNAF